MRKMLLHLPLLLLLFRGFSLFAQDVTENISAAEAKTLLQSLTQSKQDTAAIDVLLRLALYNILKPGEDKPDLDSAAAFLVRARQLNAKINSSADSGYIAFVQSCLYRERGLREPGKRSADSAIAQLKNGQDKYHLGEAYFERSQYDEYSNPDQAVEKIQLAEQSAQAFQLSTHVECYAYALKYLADLYELHGDLLKSLKAIRLSLDTYRSIHYLQLQGVYNVFASLYYDLGDYRTAIDFEMKALEVEKSMGDSTMQFSETNDGIAILLVQSQENEKAIPFFKDAIRVAERYHDNGTVLQLAANAADNYIRIHQPAAALAFLHTVPKEFLVAQPNEKGLIMPTIYLHLYSEWAKYKEARVYANQVEELIRQYRTLDATKLNNCYFALASFYSGSRDFPAARRYLAKLDSLTRKMGDPYRIKEAYHVRFKLDTAEGNFKAGIRDLVMYQQINDSMLNETKSRQIKQLEVLYDKQQQQDEIKLKDQNISLLNQTNEVQQLHLRQAVRLRNETLAGSALLLIVGGLFYRQYRQKLKTNRIISHQNADISKKNELLEHLLKEKEWLLKEVHHRVKNNLHTVICLLESQAASLESDALKAFENSQHRIYAMSLIHQKLYQSEDIKTIDMSLYLPEFIQYLKDSFDTPRRIVFFFDIEPIKLGVSQAIPIALIINEAVTNAIKYAFNGRSNGRIEIRMHHKADQITLTISDNGVGIDPLVLMAPSESLGLKLMNGLSEDINGDIRIITDDGTTIKICFAIDLLANAYHPLSQAAIQD